MNSKSCWGQWLIVKLKTKVAVALRHLGSILIVQSYRNSPNSSSSHFIFSLYTVFVILGILIISWQNNGPGASDSRRGSCPRDTVWQFITPAELRGAGVITPSISDNNGCWYAASLPFNSTGQRSMSWYPCQEVFCNYQGEHSRLLRCVCVCVCEMLSVSFMFELLTAALVYVFTGSRGHSCCAFSCIHHSWLGILNCQYLKNGNHISFISSQYQNSTQKFKIGNIKFIYMKSSFAKTDNSVFNYFQKSFFIVHSN